MRLTAYQTLLLSVLLGALLVAFLWGEQEDAPVITIKLLAPEVLIAEPILMKLTFYNPTDKPIKIDGPLFGIYSAYMELPPFA
jgi:hypothetical protein